MEHNVLGTATTILEHSTQSLDIFMDRQTAGMLRLSLRYNQVKLLTPDKCLNGTFRGLTNL